MSNKTEALHLIETRMFEAEHQLSLAASTAIHDLHDLELMTLIHALEHEIRALRREIERNS